MSAATDLLNRGAVRMEAQFPDTLTIGATAYPGVAIDMTSEAALNVGYQHDTVKSGISIRRASLATAPAVGALAALSGTLLRVAYVKSDEISHDIYLEQR